MSVNIGDTISYSNQYEEVVSGKITEVISEMDSYEDKELHDGVAYYES